MADEMKCLARGTATNSLATVYTVPAGKRTTVRTLDVFNTHTASVGFNLSLGGVVQTSGWVIGTLDGVNGEGYDVLEAGETIQLSGSVTGVLKYHINGVESDI